MILIDSLCAADHGRWVVYRDRFGGGPDYGRIKGWNSKFIFVVYRCGGNWKEFACYTAVATDPGDLEFKDK